MFNTEGEIIGVVSFIISKSGGFDGAGFTTAINSSHHSIIESSGFVAGFDGMLLPDLERRALGLQQEAVLVRFNCYISIPIPVKEVDFQITGSVLKN